MWVVVLSLLEGGKGSGFDPRNNKIAGVRHSIVLWEGDSCPYKISGSGQGWSGWCITHSITF